MSLQEYRAKRNFRQTREPSGRAEGLSPARQPRFVVQKHAASHLHYDFRLEMGGVLKSWAVPKGFPTSRGERRLAVQVEDHPLEYRDFEGIIPAGNYGAGTVMVWDRGTYRLSEGDAKESLRSGKLHLRLEGKKLKGEWTLVRMRRAENAEKPQWLLMKSGSDARPISARAQDRSAATGRSLAQIAAAQDAAWESHQPARPKPSAPNPKPQTVTAGENLKGLPRATPRFAEPMKALLVKNLPNGANWNFEIKFDGVRALAIKRNRKLALRSRADKDLRLKYQPIATALEKLPVGQVVLDGEIVAVDESGRSAFQLLQSYQSSPGSKPRLLYYVFDILNLEGRDLTGLPLWQRKHMAERVMLKSQPEIRFSASIHADSARVVREMRKRGLEGLVAKLRDSRYEPGRRSGAWVKFKWTLEQEFVIGGYTEPKGARAHFGALLVGYYQDRRLLFAAKVGTGFDERGLTELHARLQQLRTEACPFSNLPAKGGLTSAGMRRCTWVEPKLVCQVRFSEWTRDGHLRQPAFLGLREDKEPHEVSREIPQ